MAALIFSMASATMRPVVVGLTGGIGMGKSSAATWFKRCGFRVHGLLTRQHLQGLPRTASVTLSGFHFARSDRCGPEAPSARDRSLPPVPLAHALRSAHTHPRAQMPTPASIASTRRAGLLSPRSRRPSQPRSHWTVVSTALPSPRRSRPRGVRTRCACWSTSCTRSSPLHEPSLCDKRRRCAVGGRAA